MTPKPLLVIIFAVTALLSSAAPATAAPQRTAALSGLDVRVSASGSGVNLSYTIQCATGSNYYLTGVFVRQGDAVTWDDSLPLPYKDKIACGTPQTWAGNQKDAATFHEGPGKVTIQVAVCQINDPTLCQEFIVLDRRARFHF